MSTQRRRPFRDVLRDHSRHRGASELWKLAIVFSLVPAACLVAWTVLGTALSRAPRRAATAVWFDRAMRTMLVASAIALVVVQ